MSTNVKIYARVLVDGFNAEGGFNLIGRAGNLEAGAAFLGASIISLGIIVDGFGETPGSFAGVGKTGASTGDLCGRMRDGAGFNVIEGDILELGAGFLGASIIAEGEIRVLACGVGSTGVSRGPRR